MNVNVNRGVLRLAVAGLLAVWIGGSLVAPAEGKKKPGGDDGTSYEACVLLDDSLAIYSDGDGDGEYCHDSRNKVLVMITGGSNAGFRLTAIRATGGQRADRRRRFLRPCRTGCDLGVFTPRVISESGQREVDFRIQSEYVPDGTGGWTPVGTGRLDLLSMGEGSENAARAGLTSGPLLNFDPDPPGAFDCPLADPVRVTRIDEYTWVIETEIGEDRAASFDVIDNDWNNPVFRGVYYMPFRMIVTVPDLAP